MKTHMRSNGLLSRRSMLIGAGAVLVLSACEPSAQTQASKEKSPMNNQKPKAIAMNVALFGYQDRPIFDVYLNGIDIGVSAGQPFRGNAGIMLGVDITPGPQIITWRDGATGITSKAVNQPIFTDPGDAYGYLGVHIYPDNTVELVPDKHSPEKTTKGLEIIQKWELKHGQ
jgi:hypothetical protein